jgi:hypothetical protein
MKRAGKLVKERLDVLVGEMETAEVPQLLEAVSGKQEEFIRKHVIRELLRRGGDELTLLLRWFGIYRQPVSKEGVRRVGLWVLEEKNREFSTADDAFLLNEVGITLNDVGDYRKAIDYVE